MDWTHQWENFEMYMYAVSPADGDTENEGIFMQVSRQERASGALLWEILYDRKLADLAQVSMDSREETSAPGSEAWEEQMLRKYLRGHPELVDEEKRYLQAFLESG